MRPLLLRCLYVVGIGACGGAGSRTERPSIANTVERTPRRAANTTICKSSPTGVEPITAAELERAVTPPDDAAARTLLLGPWTGHAFALDGPIGQPGSNPEPGTADARCFDVDGHASVRADADHSARDGGDCKPRSRTYRIRRDEEAGDELVLEERLSGGCPDDAGYDRPYVHPYYVSRLDERFLVLVDGVTGNVTGYRRR